MSTLRPEVCQVPRPMLGNRFQSDGRSLSTKTEASDPSGLLHPLWWGALILLLVNDHLLKGSLLPGWLTGKLSDFAGLIVAPVLLASLVPSTRFRARLVSFLAVVIPFAAIKLWSPAAEGLIGALRAVGLHWRLWSDWTDLSALIVLPLAWRLSSGTPTAPRLLPKWLFPACRYAGVLLGGLACMATSEAAEEFETAAYLVNVTHESVDVRLFRVSQPLDCAAVRPDKHAALTAALFAYESCKRAEPFALVPLDKDWREVSENPQHDNSDAGAWRECDAVLVRIPGAADTLLFWDRLSKTSVHTSSYHVSNDDLNAHAVLVEKYGDKLVLGPGALFEAWTVDWVLSSLADTCAEAP